MVVRSGKRRAGSRMRPYAIMARGHVVCPSLVIIVVSDHGERPRQAWSRAGLPVNLLREMGGTRELLKVPPATKYLSFSLQSFKSQCRAVGCLSRLYLASFLALPPRSGFSHSSVVRSHGIRPSEPTPSASAPSRVTLSCQRPSA